MVLGLRKSVERLKVWPNQAAPVKHIGRPQKKDFSEKKRKMEFFKKLFYGDKMPAPTKFFFQNVGFCLNFFMKQ